MKTLHVCTNLSARHFPQFNIKVIFQSKKQLSNLFQFKESTPLYLHSLLITNFNVVTAILLILIKLNVIVKLVPVNIKCIPINKKKVNNSKQSVVKDFCLLSGQVCSFDDFTILN